MTIDRNHPLFEILEGRGIDTTRAERELNESQEKAIQQLTQLQQEKEEEIERPKEFDEVLDFLEARWGTYETVEPVRQNSVSVTRSELLNLAMKTPFRGKFRNLLGAVIDIRERDIIANQSFEGIGLESVKIEVEEMSNASREYLTSKGVSNLDNKLVDYNDYRFMPEVFKVDRNINTIDVGFNKVFKFTTYTQQNNLPDMTVPQDNLIVRCYLDSNFRNVTRVEMRLSAIDRLEFEGDLTRELKNYDVNIPLNDMPEFLRVQRDISLTDIIDVTDDDIKRILLNKSLRGYI